jgi:signal transduction histidine kinase
MASHEFRTPLSTIFSSVTLLNKYIHSEDPSKVEKHLDRIASAVNNLNDILNEFLSLGKIEDGKIEPKWAMNNLKSLTESAINQMEPLCKQGQIIRHTHEGGEEALLDERLLTNIFINLISNAIKFSPENSNIEIKTHKKQRSIQIEISDQGMGIAEEEQKHLFERFFRSKNVTNIQGTGLGLHIVSRYIQLMNGKILCKSVPHQGTTFTIQIPNHPKYQASL